MGGDNPTVTDRLQRGDFEARSMRGAVGGLGPP
jgi:hypothetical protein